MVNSGLSRSAFFLFCSTLLILWGSDVLAASSGYEVRLAVGQGLSRVRLKGEGLVILDADIGDVLKKSSKSLTICSSSRGLVLEGVRVRPRSLIVKATSAIVVNGRSLMGDVEIRKNTKGILVVNRLSLERYLMGLLGAEMGPKWPLEALKAQAVAARTFFMNRRLDREDAPYDVSASTLDQVYRGIALESERTQKAVKDTEGLVLTWGNMPAETLFHACCGGRTHSSEEVFGGQIPYLRSVNDPDCSNCPKHRWLLELRLLKVVRKLAKRGWRGDIDKIEQRDGFLVFLGKKGKELKLRTMDFRNLMGAVLVPSPWFSVSIKGDKLVLHGRGSGHGVGMCQWGARGMAERGESFRAILMRYYPACKLRKLF